MVEIEDGKRVLGSGPYSARANSIDREVKGGIEALSRPDPCGRATWASMAIDKVPRKPPRGQPPSDGGAKPAIIPLLAVVIRVFLSQNAIALALEPLDPLLLPIVDVLRGQPLSRSHSASANQSECSMAGKATPRNVRTVRSTPPGYRPSSPACPRPTPPRASSGAPCGRAARTGSPWPASAQRTRPQ